MVKDIFSKLSVRLGVGFAIAALLALVFQHAWPLFVFSTLGLIFFTPLPEKISASPSLRIILSIVLLTSLIQIEGTLGYVLKVDLNPFVYGVINALLVSVLAMAVARPKMMKWSLDDVWTLAVPLIVVGGLVFSMVTLTTRDNMDINSAIIHKVTTTSDESNHINTFALSIESGGDMRISPAAYPSGWHVATTTLVSSVVDLSDKPFIQTVTAYYIMKLLGVFLAVASIMALLIAVARLALKSHAPYYLLFALSTLFIVLALIIPNSEINGFYNFVPQYAYFSLAFLLLLYAKNNLKVILPLLIIFILASFMSWLITGLLLAGLVAVSLLAPRLASVKIKSGIWGSVLQFGLLGALLLAVFLVALPGGMLGRIVDILEHPGGWIEGYNLIAYPVLFLLLVACGVLTSKSNLPIHFRTALVSFFGVVGLVFIVTALRGYGGEQLSYYWQKVLFPLFPIAVSVLVVLGIQKLVAMTKHVASVYTGILLSMVLLASTVVGQASFDLSLRVIGNQNFLHKSQNANINKPIEELFINNQFNSETVDRYVFVTSGNYTLDQMVYQLMSRSITNNLDTKETCLPPYNVHGGYYGENVVLLKNIASEYCGHEVKFVVSNETIDQVKQYKDEKDLINIDTDF